MTKQFETFIVQLSETNATLDYFTDFNKVIENVNKISIKLNQLNYLLGNQDLRKAIDDLFMENPKVFEVLDILIATRIKNIPKTINKHGTIVKLDSYFNSPEKIFEYIQETGLEEIFINKNITNLVDYVFGIEVGLDSNARKNRGGTNMAKAVSKIFDMNEIFYKTEIPSTEFKEILNLGADVKQFDFVIKTKLYNYLIETNYYNTGGSKLNETARSYSDISLKINTNSKYKFVWITDGQGWLNAKNKLEEAFNIIPNIYNLKTLKEFVLKINKEGCIKW